MLVFEVKFIEEREKKMEETDRKNRSFLLQSKVEVLLASLSVLSAQSVCWAICCFVSDLNLLS